MSEEPSPLPVPKERPCPVRLNELGLVNAVESLIILKLEYKRNREAAEEANKKLAETQKRLKAARIDLGEQALLAGRQLVIRPRTIDDYVFIIPLPLDNLLEIQEQAVPLTQLEVKP